MQAALALKIEEEASATDLESTADIAAAAAVAEAARESGIRVVEIPPAHSGANSAFVEVQLPMKLSHKWVAYACRTAGVAKPRWNRITSIWTTTVLGEAGLAETISITSSNDGMSIRVLVEWAAVDGAPTETATARRLATAFVTTMRDGLRRRSAIRESYARVRVFGR